MGLRGWAACSGNVAILLAFVAALASGVFIAQQRSERADAGDVPGVLAPISLANGRLVVEPAPARRHELLDAQPVPTSGNRIETNHGFAVVVDAVKEADGLMEIAYHLEGSLDGLTGVGKALTLANGDQTPRYFGGRSTRAYLGEPVVAQVPAAELSDGARLLFPSAVRLHDEPVEVELTPTPGGAWAGRLEIEQEAVEFVATLTGGFLSVTIVGEEAESLVVDGRLVRCRMVTPPDEAALDVYHGSANYPSPGEKVRAVVTQLDFSVTGDLDGGRLVLACDGYGELLRSDWELPLSDQVD